MWRTLVCRVRKVDKKPSGTLTKGGLTATPLKFAKPCQRGSNIFKEGLNLPTPVANRPLMPWCHLAPCERHAAAKQSLLVFYRSFHLSKLAVWTVESLNKTFHHRVTWVRSSMCPIYRVRVVSALPALIAWSCHHSNCPLLAVEHLRLLLLWQIVGGRNNVTNIAHFS